MGSNDHPFNTIQYKGIYFTEYLSSLTLYIYFFLLFILFHISFKFFPIFFITVLLQEDYGLNICRHLEVSSAFYSIPEVLFHKNIINLVAFMISRALPCVQLSFHFFNHVSIITRSYYERLASLIFSTVSK